MIRLWSNCPGAIRVEQGRRQGQLGEQLCAGLGRRGLALQAETEADLLATVRREWNRRVRAERRNHWSTW